MIAITGATGHLGRATLNALLSKVPANQLIALVRNLQKATDLSAQDIQVRQGDYNAPATLQVAFQGAEKVLLISGDDLENRLQQHKNVIDAAKAAGVRHVLYTSVINPSADSHFGASPSHVATEAYLKESGLTYTLLRNTLYLDILPMMIGENALPSGQLFAAAGEGKVSYALRQDLAEATATILASPGHNNQTYDLAPAPAYSFQDVAATLSEVAGQPVQYVPITPEALAAGMREHHVPEPVVMMMVGLSKAMAADEFNLSSPTLEQLLGRRPTDLKTFLTGVYGK
ncbi:SDR family oxidoreductase [Hymenobacter profundi]|uniref:SDR family oxidoreductase n=1 Tax=Hymenobacter profundi TaxID=1982110 RepID=A0ABS6WWL2_9BACT|nr:SDR family oxidoreductase [Hymenobacter profundi]MBW3127834.1 SDR family oxidoreductase [Hymenobacter profundi]